jgi:hypothetical protein
MRLPKDKVLGWKDSGTGEWDRVQRLRSLNKQTRPSRCRRFSVSRVEAAHRAGGMQRGPHRRQGMRGDFGLALFVLEKLQILLCLNSEARGRLQASIKK